MENTHQLVVFSTPTCSVCTSLHPKINELFEDKFPEIGVTHIDITQQPESTSKYSVYSAPTALLFLDGREYLRFTGSFSLNELEEKTQRYYTMLFS